MAVGNSQHKKKTITAIKHNYSNERKTTKNIFNFIFIVYICFGTFSIVL